MDWVDKPQNYKDMYGILQLLQGSHLNNFLLKTLKLGWVAFYSLTFQLKCLDFQSNQTRPSPLTFLQLALRPAYCLADDPRYQTCEHITSHTILQGLKNVQHL